MSFAISVVGGSALIGAGVSAAQGAAQGAANDKAAKLAADYYKQGRTDIAEATTNANQTLQPYVQAGGNPRALLGTLAGTQNPVLLPARPAKKTVPPKPQKSNFPQGGYQKALDKWQAEKARVATANEKATEAWRTALQKAATAAGVTLPWGTGPDNLAAAVQQYNTQASQLAAPENANPIESLTQTGGLLELPNWQNYQDSRGMAPADMSGLFTGLSPDQFAAALTGNPPAAQPGGTTAADRWAGNTANTGSPAATARSIIGTQSPAGTESTSWLGSMLEQYGPKQFARDSGDPGFSLSDIYTGKTAAEVLRPFGMDPSTLVKDPTQTAATQLREYGFDPARFGRGVDDLSRDWESLSGQSYQDLLAEPTGFEASPGYQWALQQGKDAVQSSAAARGSLLSGATLKALTDYGTGMANQDYTNWWNRQMASKQTALGERGNYIGQNQTSAGQGLAAGQNFAANQLALNSQGLGLLQSQQATDLADRNLLGQTYQNAQNAATTNQARNLAELWNARNYQQALQNRTLADYYSQAGLTGQQQGQVFNFLNTLAGNGQTAATNQAQNTFNSGLSLANLAQGQGSALAGLALQQGQNNANMLGGIGNAINSGVANGLGAYFMNTGMGGGGMGGGAGSTYDQWLKMNPGL